MCTDSTDKFEKVECTDFWGAISLSQQFKALGTRVPAGTQDGRGAGLLVRVRLTCEAYRTSANTQSARNKKRKQKRKLK